MHDAHPAPAHTVAHHAAMHAEESQTQIDTLLAFWFASDQPEKKWFTPSIPWDEAMRGRFGTLIEAARDGGLSDWQKTPRGTLALLLLLDQMPRNVYRGSALSYASDARGKKVALQAIALGQDRQVPLMQQVFFYLPLEHDESLVSQVACVALCEGLKARADAAFMPMADLFLSYAVRHQEAIVRWGRYPARNQALGRPSTPQETAYLKDHPTGF